MIGKYSGLIESSGETARKAKRIILLVWCSGRRNTKNTYEEVMYV
jgi:hypothetical protein